MPTVPVLYVAGATGYLGSRFLARYRSHAYLIPIIRRRPQPIEGVLDPIYFHDLERPSVRDPYPDLPGSRVLLHFVGCSRESRVNEIHAGNVGATDTLLRACQPLRVERIIYLSGFGITSESQSVYYRAKLAAEDLINETSISSLILRLSYVLGGQDELTPWLLVSSTREGNVRIPGEGSYRIQPIHVDQLLEIVFRLATDPTNQEKDTVNILGPVVTFRSFLTDYLQQLGLNASIVSSDLGEYVRQAVVSPTPQFTLSQLGIMFADKIGPETSEMAGVRLYSYRELLSRLAASFDEMNQGES